MRTERYKQSGVEYVLVNKHVWERPFVTWVCKICAKRANGQNWNTPPSGAFEEFVGNCIDKVYTLEDYTLRKLQGEL